MQKFTDGDVTREASTVDQYRSIYFRLERRTRNDLGLSRDADVSPQQVAATFLGAEVDWAEATAKLYRAALVFVFEDMNTEESLEAKELVCHSNEDGEWAMQVKERIRIDRKRRKRTSPKTSAQKAKRLSMEDLFKLRAELHASWSKCASQTDCWFMAGIITGLRPTEWKNAKLAIDTHGRKVLVVQNAKNTNGRAHGKERSLVLDQLSAEDYAIIEVHVNAVAEKVAEGEFESFYYDCRRLLSNVADRLWPRRVKHPTLYTPRHLFSANMKNDFDSVGVAAMMGHASTTTAFTHYAPRWTGTGGNGVYPSENDIKTVAALNEKKITPREEKKQKFIEQLRQRRSNKR